MVWLPIPFSACAHINPWTAVQTTPYADVVAVSALRGSSQGAHSKRGAVLMDVGRSSSGFERRSVRSTRISLDVSLIQTLQHPQTAAKLSGVMTRKSLRAGLRLPNGSSVPSRAPPHATPGIVRSSGLRDDYHHRRLAPVMLHARAASGNHVVHD
jgi:hypothetical protein